MGGQKQLVILPHKGKETLTQILKVYNSTGGGSGGFDNEQVQQAGWTVDSEDDAFISAHRYVQDGDLTTLRREGAKFTKNKESNWDKANTIIGAWGLASGVKETMIEGGAALNRSVRIYNINSTSLIRTYGVSGARYLKIIKVAGVAGSVFSTGYSAYKVYDQYNRGNASEVFKHRDVIDAGVGVVGLGATGLAALGMISNPVGWGIGVGVLIYGGATLIYDAVNNED